EAAACARILGSLVDELLLGRLLPVERLLLLWDDLVLGDGELLGHPIGARLAVGRDLSIGSLTGGARAVSALVVFGGFLELRRQRGERSRQDVDLVLGEFGVLGQSNRLRGEQSLQPQEQRVLLPPSR